MNKIKDKIQAAVEDGKLTQEEADQKLLHMKERSKKEHLGGKHHKPPLDMDKIKDKIQAAVEDGKLTQEEADQKLLHMKERSKKEHHLFINK